MRHLGGAEDVAVEVAEQADEVEGVAQLCSCVLLEATHVGTRRSRERRDDAVDGRESGLERGAVEVGERDPSQPRPPAPELRLDVADHVLATTGRRSARRPPPRSAASRARRARGTSIRTLIRSLSTSTPSQSKMTRSQATKARTLPIRVTAPIHGRRRSADADPRMQDPLRSRERTATMAVRRRMRRSLPPGFAAVWALAWLLFRLGTCGEDSDISADAYERLCEPGGRIFRNLTVIGGAAVLVTAGLGAAAYCSPHRPPGADPGGRAHGRRRGQPRSRPPLSSSTERVAQSANCGWVGRLGNRPRGRISASNPA